MDGVTIGESAKFVSVMSFDLGAADMSAVSAEVRQAVERLVPNKEGFIGCVVMANDENRRPNLLVVSIWESGHAWSAAQYDEQIGQVLSDVVETAKAYEVQTYNTITVVRA